MSETIDGVHGFGVQTEASFSLNPAGYENKTVDLSLFRNVRTTEHPLKVLYCFHTILAFQNLRGLTQY
jgi:hypothetical protein